MAVPGSLTRTNAQARDDSGEGAGVTLENAID